MVLTARRECQSQMSAELAAQMAAAKQAQGDQPTFQAAAQPVMESNPMRDLEQEGEDDNEETAKPTLGKQVQFVSYVVLGCRGPLVYSLD